jgi:hypothetical protein
MQLGLAGFGFESVSESILPFAAKPGDILQPLGGREMFAKDVLLIAVALDQIASQQLRVFWLAHRFSFPLKTSSYVPLLVSCGDNWGQWVALHPSRETA